MHKPLTMRIAAGRCVPVNGDVESAGSCVDWNLHIVVSVDDGEAEEQCITVGHVKIARRGNVHGRGISLKIIVLVPVQDTPVVFLIVCLEWIDTAISLVTGGKRCQHEITHRSTRKRKTMLQ